MPITEKTPADMSAPSWLEAYAQFRQFLNLNPQIKIDRDTVLIPGEVKEEFYRFFDAVRIALIKEKCPTAIERGLELSWHYKALRTGLLKETGFDAVETSSDLTWFLEDPVDGLRRFLYDPLFKLLAGQIEAAEFAQIALGKINSAFANLFREGYQRWVALAILRRLRPDISYRFPAKDSLQDVLMGEGHENPGQHADEVPPAQEIRGLSFEQHPVISFIVPRIAVHSRRTGAFVAMHSEFKEAEWRANRYAEMEWLEIAALKEEYKLFKIRPDLIKKAWYELDPILPDLAIYTADEVNNLSLVADFKRMLRPEINIAIMESADWSEKVKPEDLKRRLLTLHPRQGAFIVCQQEIPAATIATFGNEEGLKLISVGYDENALEAIASLISPPS